MIRKMLSCLLFGVALSWADATKIKQLFELILGQLENRVAPEPEEVVSKLGPGTIDALSGDEVKSLLPLAKQCLQSSQLDVRRDGLPLLVAVALRPDSSQLLDPYVDDLGAIMGDAASPLNQGAAAVLAMTRPTMSSKAIATMEAHWRTKVILGP